MAILGPRALMDIAVPTGIDAGVLARLQMEQGLTAQEILGVATGVIGLANEYVRDRWGGIFYVTEQRSARYRQSDGSRTMTPKAAEFSKPDGVRGDQIGHMLPREDYTDALQWSAKWLKRADKELVNFDLAEIKERWINRCDYEVITRLLSDAELAIGSSGYSPGWATGTGYNLNFIPPQWRGYKFTSAHIHYLRTNGALSATTAATMLNKMAKELSHHGFTGRKVALVSEADVDTYTAMDATKFAAFKPQEFLLTTGGSSALQTVQGELQGIPGETFGYWSSPSGVIELKYHERIPTTYLWMGKSFGVDNQDNPLALATEKGVGFGLKVIPQVNNNMVPELDHIQFEATHGWGVNDRLNGVAAQIASGSTTYAAPTIT